MKFADFLLVVEVLHIEEYLYLLNIWLKNYICLHNHYVLH
jgi:hypothetical protein